MSDSSTRSSQSAEQRPETDLFTGLFQPAGVPEGGDEAKRADDRKPSRRSPGVVGEASRAAGAGWFTVLYCTAVLVGVIPTFVSHQFWPVPMLAMLVYVVVGYPKARQTGTVFEFADSVYYLGFTLSIGSLLASLEPFNMVKRPDPEQIFHYFGLGMLTTLAGVVGRTSLQMYHRLPAETLEEVNRRVTDEAHRYLEQLTELNARIARSVSTTVASYEESLVPQLKELERSLSVSVEHLRGAADATGALKDRSAEAGEALDSVVRRYKASAEQVAASHSAVVRAAGELAEQLGSAAVATKTSAEQVGSGLGTVAERAVAARGALEELAGRVSALRIDPAPLAGSIETAGRAVTDAARVASREIAAFAAAVGAFEENATAARAAGVAAASPQIREALDQLQREVAKLSDSIRQQRNVTSSEVETLRQHVQATLATARDMSAALDEIANVTLRRLERVESPSALNPLT